MYAIIATGGKQYKVAEGDIINVEKLGVAAGEAVTFDQVLAVNNGELAIGCPTVEGATVSATVVKEGKAKKVIVYKYKRKSGYHKYESIRMLGHAGLADDHQEGQELVCAAVSALVLNMANSIEQFTDDSFEADQDEEAGGFNFRFTDQISPESRLLMNSLVFGLQNIEDE